MSAINYISVKVKTFILPEKLRLYLLKTSQTKSREDVLHVHNMAFKLLRD